MAMSRTPVWRDIAGGRSSLFYGTGKEVKEEEQVSTSGRIVVAGM